MSSESLITITKDDFKIFVSYNFNLQNDFNS